MTKAKSRLAKLLVIRAPIAIGVLDFVIATNGFGLDTVARSLPIYPHENRYSNPHRAHARLSWLLPADASR
jgi:hypothetical protein